jgi:hypothetical protein
MANQGVIAMIVETVKQKLGFLFDLGFEIVPDHYDSSNWIVILSHDEILLRIIHDRSDWFIDVGFKFIPDAWYELWDVLWLLKKQGIVQNEYYPKNKIQPLKAILRSCIKNILQVDLYQNKLSTLNTR